MGATEFMGSSDPMVVDEWIVHTESIFEVLQSSGRLRVALVGYMFREVADTWWKSIVEPYHFMDDEVSLQTFTEQFRRKFIPEHMTLQKKIEFERMTQDDLSVAEYIHEFTKLSRFPTRSVDTEEKKIERFLEGLKAEIHKDVTAIMKPLNFDEAVTRAYWSEEENARITARDKEKRSCTYS